MRVSLLLVGASLLVGDPADGQQRRIGSADSAVTAGLGLDGGLIGLKYVRRLGPAPPLEASLGLGFVGVAPGLVWRVAERGSWSGYASAAVLYSPWESLLTGKGSTMAVGGLGVQRWPTQSTGVYLNAGVEPYAPLGGTFEDGEAAGVAVRVQVGWAF